jgi:hypothetical protein
LCQVGGKRRQGAEQATVPKLDAGGEKQRIARARTVRRRLSGAKGNAPEPWNRNDLAVLIDEVSLERAGLIR